MRGRNSRIKYSKDLQRRGEESKKSYAQYAVGAGVLILVIWFLVHSSGSKIDAHDKDKNSDKTLVKASERLIMADSLEKLIDANPSICMDRPQLLNHDDTNCEDRVSMLKSMNIFCEKDENALVSCCKTCEQEHMLRGKDGNDACMDREQLLKDNDDCPDLMRTLFYVGMDCKTTEEAQKMCCLTCNESEYFNKNVVKDFNEFMKHGDCTSAFKEMSMQKKTCSGNDEASKFCRATCRKLENLYGDNACWDLDFKLAFANCHERTLLLQKYDKPCDDDPEIAKECCQSCSPHLMENGCWDSLYLIDGKRCVDHVKELKLKGETCPDSLREKCCRSCDFDRCDDSMALIRKNECSYHTMMLKLSKMTCKDDKEVEEKCCKSCTETFGRR